MTHEWLYTLRERFRPEVAPGWKDYLAFSGFRDIVEMVTLDLGVCPQVITNLRDEDWTYNVHADFRIMFFRDAEYLMTRQPIDSSRHQILAILESPNGSEVIPSGFKHCGYDIMDSYLGNSTLTNCGQIPEAFDPSIVTEFGLISDYATAIDVRDKMRQLEPDDPHLGACEVWAIARAYAAYESRT
ncbi:hypothetical protein [Schlesneria paludicola]|uniref:hypothetical protein n=1 Tax=Schlesneria paludicola TaxID=360056 RepID=UPI00029A7EDD|nr:hypothetical protein [Schlesneria paludicola]